MEFSAIASAAKKWPCVPCVSRLPALPELALYPAGLGPSQSQVSETGGWMVTVLGHDLVLYFRWIVSPRQCRADTALTF